MRSVDDRLAIYGGEPVRKGPFPRERKVGKEEIEELKEVVESGWLFRWGGKKVEEFERLFAQRHGVRFGIASTSGTAAIHTAIGSLQIEPGDEIVVPPITDIGTIIPILKEGGIPVFADIDPKTGNIDPDEVKRLMSGRTKAIMVVHLAGNPCDMDGISEIAKGYGIALIEDCSQAYLAEYKGRLVGTIGNIGCFSLQQSKHITTGDGGICITDDEELAIRISLFMDKGWERRADVPHRRYPILGMNYRMNELTGAVAVAQMRRLDMVVRRRRELGGLLTQLISDCEYVIPQKILDGCQHSYWHYEISVRPDAPFGADLFSKALQGEGIPASAHYIGKPIFLCHEALRRRQIFGGSMFPFNYSSRDIRYDEGTCPKAQDYLDHLVILPIHEGLNEEDIEDMARAIVKVERGLRKGG